MFALSKPRTQSRSLDPYSPWENDFFKDFNFIFRDAFNDLEKKVSNLVSTNSHYEITEMDDRVELNLFIPKIDNISKDDISVSFDNDVLRVQIQSEKKSENGTKTNVPDKFYMQYNLYNSKYNIDKEKIEAELKNGSLNISMPKIDKTLKIKVK